MGRQVQSGWKTIQVIIQFHLNKCISTPTAYICPSFDALGFENNGYKLVITSGIFSKKKVRFIAYSTLLQ